MRRAATNVNDGDVGGLRGAATHEVKERTVRIKDQRERTRVRGQVVVEVCADVAWRGHQTVIHRDERHIPVVVVPGWGGGGGNRSEKGCFAHSQHW